MFGGQGVRRQAAGHEFGHEVVFHLDGESLVDLVEQAGQGDAHGQLDDLAVREMLAHPIEHGVADPPGALRHADRVVAHQTFLIAEARRTVRLQSRDTVGVEAEFDQDGGMMGSTPRIKARWHQH